MNEREDEWTEASNRMRSVFCPDWLEWELRSVVGEDNTVNGAVVEG